MKIEDVDEDTDDSVAMKDKTHVNGNATVDEKPKEKQARRMKIQEVESDDEECEEIIVNGNASKEEKLDDKVTKDIWDSSEVQNGGNSVAQNTTQYSNSDSVTVKVNETIKAEQTKETSIIDEHDNAGSKCNNGRAASPVAVEENPPESSDGAKSEDKDNGNKEIDPDTEASVPMQIQRPVFYTKELPASCSSLKEEAGALFKSGQYGDASQKYSKLISLLVKGKFKKMFKQKQAISVSRNVTQQAKVGSC